MRFFLMMRWSMGMSDCESRSMVDFDSGLEVESRSF